MTAAISVAAPACVPWCTETHAGEAGWDDVRTHAGGIEACSFCRSNVVEIAFEDGGSISVIADRYASYDSDEQPLKVEPPRVRVDDTWGTPAQARALAAALIQAADLAESGG